MIENDSSKGMWCAVYKRTSDGFLQVEAPRMIEGNNNLRLYLKNRSNTDVVIMSRDKGQLAPELSEKEAQQLSTVELAKTKKSKPEKEISDEEAIAAFKEEAKGKEKDLKGVEDSVGKQDLTELPTEEENAPGLEEAPEAKD